MALDLGELVAKLRIDDSDWSGALDRADGKARGFGSSVLGTMGGVVGGITALWGGVEIGQFFMDGIDYASDLSETLSKSTKIFGDQAGAVEAWSRNASTSVGLSQNAAVAAAAGFGDMFTQIGFAGAEAANMSTNAVQMAADLGSFSNLDTADVADRMSAAFRGEYDSLQAVIPGINAARVESEALAMTGKDTAASLTAQEKAAAVLAIVQKDGARAMGDFADTSDGYANSSKIVAAQMEELGGKVGQLVLPALQGLQAILLDNVIPAMEGVVEWIGQNLDLLGQLGTALAIAGGAWVIMTAGVAAYNAIMTTYRAIQAAGTVAQWAFNAAAAANPVGLVIIAITALIAVIVLLVMNWDTVVSFITEIWNGFIAWIVEVTAGFVEGWNAMWAAVGAWISEVWNGIVTAVSGFVQGMVDFIVAVITGYVSFWMGVWQSVLDFVVGVWNGIVSGVSGFVTALVNFIIAAITGYVAFWQSVWQGVASFVAGVWNGIMSTVSGIVSGLVNFFRSSFQGVADFLSGIWRGIASVISDTWNGVMSFLSGIPGQIMGFFSGIGGWLYSAGRDLINGLLNGIRSLAGTIGSFFLNMLPDWIVGPFKAAMGIASPSKLFREYGQNTVQGYLRGVEDLKPDLDAEMAQLVNAPEVQLAGAAAPSSSVDARPNVTTHKEIHYHAAEHQSLSSEEALFAALSSPRAED